MTALGRAAQALRTFASDVAEGFFEITHNGFALLGLAVAFALITLMARPDLRQTGEAKLMGWLQARHIAALGMQPEPSAGGARDTHHINSLIEKHLGRLEIGDR